MVSKEATTHLRAATSREVKDTEKPGKLPTSMTGFIPEKTDLLR